MSFLHCLFLLSFHGSRYTYCHVFFFSSPFLLVASIAVLFSSIPSLIIAYTFLLPPFSFLSCSLVLLHLSFNSLPFPSFLRISPLLLPTFRLFLCHTPLLHLRQPLSVFSLYSSRKLLVLLPSFFTITRLSYTSFHPHIFHILTVASSFLRFFILSQFRLLNLSSVSFMSHVSPKLFSFHSLIILILSAARPSLLPLLSVACPLLLPPPFVPRQFPLLSLLIPVLPLPCKLGLLLITNVTNMKQLNVI